MYSIIIRILVGKFNCPNLVQVLGFPSFDTVENSKLKLSSDYYWNEKKINN